MERQKGELSMNRISYITRIDYLGPHHISTTGEMGTNYSITSIVEQTICKDSLCVKEPSEQTQKAKNNMPKQ